MIGLLLVVIAAVLAVEMKSLLIGESASREHQHAIKQALPGEGVDSVIHMRTLHLGPEELLVAAKIAVSPTATGAELAHAIDAAERRVRTAVPIAPCHLSRTRPGPIRRPRHRNGDRRGPAHILMTVTQIVLISPRENCDSPKT
jgi:divalent metal cation (Fe/Co/Zn/Cd) transporter